MSEATQRRTPRRSAVAVGLLVAAVVVGGFWGVGTVQAGQQEGQPGY